MPKNEFFINIVFAMPPRRPSQSSSLNGRLIRRLARIYRRQSVSGRNIISQLRRQREEDEAYIEFTRNVFFRSLCAPNCGQSRHVHNMPIPDYFYMSGTKTRQQAQEILGDGFVVERVTGSLKDQGYFIYCTYDGVCICMRFSNDFIFTGDGDSFITNLSREVHPDIADRMPVTYGRVRIDQLMILFCLIKSRCIEPFDVDVPEDKRRSCNVENSFPNSSRVSISIDNQDVESMDIENLIYVMIDDEYYEIEYARDFESMVATAHLIMDINPEVFHPYSIL